MLPELMLGNALPPSPLCLCAFVRTLLLIMCLFAIHSVCPVCPPHPIPWQDFPNYKYRPRRKKRDGAKGATGQSNTNNNSSSINNNRSNGGSPASLIEKSELLEEKLEKVLRCLTSSHSYLYLSLLQVESMASAYSTATPPLFDSSPSPQPPPHHSMSSRSFTIPTPESSPSSCTSDVFHHSAFQPTGTGLHSPMSEARTIATYTLPTPEVSPLEPTPRPLDYQTYGSLAPHPDRFSFDGGSLAGEFYNQMFLVRCP